MLRPHPKTFQPSKVEPHPLACSVELAAKMLGISRTTLFQLIKNGKLHPIKIGRRTLLSISELMSYVEQIGGGR